jgi:hypothetical protein
VKDDRDAAERVEMDYSRDLSPAGQASRMGTKQQDVPVLHRRFSTSTSSRTLLILLCGVISYVRPFFPPQDRQRPRAPGAAVLAEWPRRIQIPGLHH